MTIFHVVRENTLTHEVLFTPYASEVEARTAMRKSWEKDAKEYQSRTGHDLPKNECHCGERAAMLTRRGMEPSSVGTMRIEDIITWRIEENEIDVRVAIRVDDGLVTEVYSNADLGVEVYNLDESEFPEEGEDAERERKEQKLEELIQESDWQQVL